MSAQSQQFLIAEVARLKDENSRLTQQVFRYRELIAALLELDQYSQSVQSDEELFQLLSRILTDALAVVESEDGSLALLDDETGELQFVIVFGQVAPYLKGKRIPSNEGIAGWVVTHQKPARVENVRLDERFSQRIDQVTGFTTRSILAVPLVGDDRVLGVVEAINKQGDAPFDELDEALIWLFCRFAGEALSSLDRYLP